MFFIYPAQPYIPSFYVILLYFREIRQIFPVKATTDLEGSRSALAEGQERLASLTAELETAQQRLASLTEELEAGQQRLASVTAELEAGKQRLASVTAELEADQLSREEGEAKLKELQQKLDNQEKQQVCVTYRVADPYLFVTDPDRDPAF
jgi:chromosome segregation ATPase